MLCPFHYYGVAEYLCSDDDPNGIAHRLDVSKGLDAKDSKQLKYEIEQLATEKRVRYIIDKLQEYGQFNIPVTGLVFCSRQEEAHISCPSCLTSSGINKMNAPIAPLPLPARTMTAGPCPKRSETNTSASSLKANSPDVYLEVQHPLLVL